MQTSDTIQAGMILGCGIVSSGAGAALVVGGRATGGPALEGGLGMALSGIGLAVVGVWVLLFVVAVLAELLRRRGPSTVAALASRCTPAMMRRLATALVGVNLLAVPAVAQASPAGSTGGPECALTAPAAARSSAPTTDIAASAGDVALPDRGTHTESSEAGRHAPGQGAEPPVAATAPRSSDPEPSPVSPAWEPEHLQVDGGPLLRGESRTSVDREEVVVAPGDSLWSIVAARLGAMATASDIAEAWPAWYDTNRAVIGDDPSLLLPGTVLQAPTG